MDNNIVDNNIVDNNTVDNNTVDNLAPKIFSPFPHQVNPHVEQVREHLADWVRHIGLVYRDSARERFERADFGWFAAVVYPTADGPHLNLVADWLVWLFLVDDQFDDGRAGREPEQVEKVVNRMRAVLESPAMEAAVVEGENVPTAVASLADLWQRTAAQASSQWGRRFVRHIEGCLTTAATWEVGNRIENIVPDEVTYAEKRRHTGAIYVCMDLIDIVEQIDIPEHVYDSPEFTAVLDAACNVVCWTNDVYSLRKERSLGEVHNLVHIVQHHRGLDRHEALSHVCAAISAETELFLAGEEKLLRAYSEHAGTLTPALMGMRAWMRGNLDWSSRTKRYRSSEDTGTAHPEDYLEPALLGGGDY